MFLLLNILPLAFFKEGLKGRAHLTKSFRQYYTNSEHVEGSAYIRRFIQQITEHGMSDAEHAKLLVLSLFTVIANTMPAAFWVVYRIFSDPVVLEDCRREVAQAVQEQDDTSTVDATFILNSCPILMSTYHEVFRVHGMANSVRVVSEDHMLDGKYRLKKGGLVMMSARAQHKNPALWGENANEFDYKRFVKQPGTARSYNPAAFRGFGGGNTLCPGRHFATSEILLFATLLLLRFDIVPTKGQWVLPPTGNSSQAEAIEQPDHDIEVELRPRPGVSKNWQISFSGRRQAELVVESVPADGEEA